MRYLVDWSWLEREECHEVPSGLPRRAWHEGRMGLGVAENGVRGRVGIREGLGSGTSLRVGCKGACRAHPEERAGERTG